jgi:hypothetical protein
MADKIVTKVDRHRSKKNAICTGLAFVLVAVLYRMFSNAPAGATASPLDNTPAAASASIEPVPALRPVIVEIPDALPRDLFDGSAAFPPEVVSAPAVTTAPTAVKPSAVDARAAIAADARNTIVLDATMLGSDPTALINGRQCRVGNVVKGFTVKRIAADHVVIERDGVRLKVSYVKPDNGRE